MIGTRLGPYEITAKLGEGGMGEVWRATDTRLDRQVAIKVLPAAFTADPERLARFEREAKLLAQLHHPNIASIFGLEESDGVRALVMELVEGEDLSARIAHGALPLDEALAIAQQIAEALEAAHERGIVHRDLKPANIKIAPDGTVKVLDFGLAKALAADGGSVPAGGLDLAHSPTLTGAHHTELGVILGTAAYMAPEQARGRVVDRRADIWAFGVVLYELLCGGSLFGAETVSDTLAGVLKSDIDFRTLPPNTPSTLRTLLRRCLERDPKNRLRDIGDARLVLDDLRSGHPGGELEVAVPPPRVSTARRGIAVWSGWGVAGLLAAAVAVVATSAQPAFDSSRLRFSPFATETASEGQPAFSPDGRSVAFVRAVAGIGQIFVRGLEADDAVQLTQDGGHKWEPFWWPDSARVGFLVDGQVEAVATAGGRPELVQASEPSSSIIMAVALSPDGATLATFRHTRSGERWSGAVWLASPPTAPPRRYHPEPFTQEGRWFPNRLRFSPDGRSLLAAFAPGVSFWLLPFPDGEASAPPRRLFAGEARIPGVPTFSWFPDSRHLALGSYTPGWRDALWLADTRTGSLDPITVGIGGEGWPDVSPDGKRLLFHQWREDFDLVAIPFDGSPLRSLLATSQNEFSASWVPNEQRLLYVTARSGAIEIRLRSFADGWDRALVTSAAFPVEGASLLSMPIASPDGSRVAFGWSNAARTRWAVLITPLAGGPPAFVWPSKGHQGVPSWSPDGTQLAFREIENGESRVVSVVVGSSQPPRVLARNASHPAWSPDGRWIAFRSGGEIAVVRPDATGRRRLAALAEVQQLAWMPDSRSLFAVSAAEDGRQTLVGIDAASGELRLLRTFEAETYITTPFTPGQRLSVAADGKSFVATVMRLESDLWLLDGLELPRHRFDRFLPWKWATTSRGGTTRQ